MTMSDSVNVSAGTEETSVEIPDSVRNMEDLDIQSGIENCGSEEGLMRALNIFAGNAFTKADEIQSFYESENIDDYTIRVHALKSSARIIGAMSLSEKARLLEEAGKNKDKEYINDKTPELLEEFRTFGKKLHAIFDEKNDDTKELISKEKLQDAYNTIYELALMMDYDSLELIFDSLKAYSFEEKDNLKLANIKKTMEDLNWDGVLKAAKESL